MEEEENKDDDDLDDEEDKDEQVESDVDQKDQGTLKSESGEEMAVQSESDEEENEEEEDEKDEDQEEIEDCASLEADEEVPDDASSEQEEELQNEEEEEEEEQESEENMDDDDDNDNDADSPIADDSSFLNDVIASSGEVLQPEPKAVFSKIVNQNHMSMRHLRDNGYNFVRYTAKGGKPLEFDIMDKSDWKTFKTLIANPNSGATWKALYYVTPTKKSIRRKTVESHMQRDLLLDPTKKMMLLKRTLGRVKNQALKM